MNDLWIRDRILYGYALDTHNDNVVFKACYHEKFPIMGLLLSNFLTDVRFDLMLDRDDYI